MRTSGLRVCLPVKMEDTAQLNWSVTPVLNTHVQVQRSAVTPFLGAPKQQFAQRRAELCACRAVLTAERHAEHSKAALQTPWSDPKWLQYKWTVYRGVAYDLTSFIDRHPAGNWLINLAIGRDCTALFESYHLRPRAASEQLKQLPVLQDFPVDAIPSSPYPNDSDLYNTIRSATRPDASCRRLACTDYTHSLNPLVLCNRERVRREVFKGQDAKGVHRTGSEGAALAILGYATIACAAYLFDTGLFTGTLLGKHNISISMSIILQSLRQHSILCRTSNKADAWPKSGCMSNLLSPNLLFCILSVTMHAMLWQVAWHATCHAHLLL